MPYQTRHTYASTMFQVGENLEYVAKMMGHANSTTTLKHYARFVQQTGVKHGSLLEAEYQKQLGGGLGTLFGTKGSLKGHCRN